jgi:hypothetical protein
MNKQKSDPKDSTYNSLEWEVEKKDQRQKYKTSNTIHAKMEWSTIRQNPAYVNALSNPFTQ